MQAPGAWALPPAPARERLNWRAKASLSGQGSPQLHGWSFGFSGELRAANPAARLAKKKPAGSPSSGPLLSYTDITGTYQRARKAIRGAQ
jgi:hypothetical protein